jgi:hypothetical protein
VNGSGGPQGGRRRFGRDDERVLSMATMNDLLLMNAAVDADGLQTPAFPMGSQNNALVVTLTVLSGTTAASNAVRYQFSNDGVNWSTAVAFGTTFDSKTAPQYISGSATFTTNVSQKYVRILVKGPAAGYVIVNLSAYTCQV